jgi:histidinol-phosphate aminotransferase
VSDAPDSTGPRIRSALQGIPTYKPGRPAAARDGGAAYKLSSNENPYPPLPSVLATVNEAATSFNRYPDMFATGLVAAIADQFDIPVTHVATGTGSVGVLQQVVQSTSAEGDEVVYAWRSFEAYPIVVQISGATSVRVPLTPDEHHDLDAMADAITDRTRLVLVCSPNNPTGTAVRRDRLERFLDRVPSDVLVVIDEAYREFVRDPAVPDALEVYRDRPNVAVLRTFSKAYGLAGLRVGFAVAHEPVAEALRKTAVPFGVSGLAQVAATASLAAEDELLERVDALVAERTRVQDALREQGWSVPTSQANFVWLRLGERTEEFAAACEAAGVVVRPFAGEGARVTIGETEGNDRFLQVAKGFVAE